jgi:hypothetical protein
LRQLSAKDIRENGIENDEISDIESLVSHSDWAVYQDVRDGIHWYFVQQRVIEERRMLQLHAQRVIKWLKHQGNMLLNLLHHEIRTDTHHLKELLLHGLRIICSLLALNHNSLFPLDQRRNLEGIPLLQHHSCKYLPTGGLWVQILDPMKSVARPDDIDAVDGGLADDEDGESYYGQIQKELEQKAWKI